MMYPEKKYEVEIAENPHSNSFSIWFKSKPEDLVFHLLQAMKFRGRSYGKEFYHPNNTNARLFAEELQQSLRKGCLPKVVQYIPTHEQAESSITTNKFSIATIHYTNDEGKTIQHEFLVFENSRLTRQSTAWLFAYLEHGEALKKVVTSEKVRKKQALQLFLDGQYKSVLPTPFGCGINEEKSESEIEVLEVQEDSLSKESLHEVKDGIEDGTVVWKKAEEMQEEPKSSKEIYYLEDDDTDAVTEDVLFDEASEENKLVIPEKLQAFDHKGRAIQLKHLEGFDWDFKDDTEKIRLSSISIYQNENKQALEYFDNWQLANEFVEQWEVENFNTENQLTVRILWENQLAFNTTIKLKDLSNDQIEIKQTIGRLIFLKLIDLKYISKRNNSADDLNTTLQWDEVSNILNTCDFGFDTKSFLGQLQHRIPIREIHVYSCQEEREIIKGIEANPFYLASAEIQRTLSAIKPRNSVGLKLLWEDDHQVVIRIRYNDIPSEIIDDYWGRILKGHIEDWELEDYQTDDSQLVFPSQKVGSVCDLSRMITDYMQGSDDQFTHAKRDSLQHYYLGRTIKYSLYQFFKTLPIKQKLEFFRSLKGLGKKFTFFSSVEFLDDHNECDAFRCNTLANLVFMKLIRMHHQHKLEESLLLNDIYDKLEEVNSRVALHHYQLPIDHSALSSFRHYESNLWYQTRLNRQIEGFIENKAKLSNYSFGEEDKNLISQYNVFVDTVYRGSNSSKAFDYYIPSKLSRKIWELASQYGFSGGRVLDPSFGIGRMVQHAPSNAKIVGYEANGIAAHIGKMLHPKVQLNNVPFESLFHDSNKKKLRHHTSLPFQLIIGKTPFISCSSRTEFEDVERCRFFEMEEYYMCKGLDLLEYGGLMILLVSPFFLKNKGLFKRCKKKIFKKASLKAVYRLSKGSIQELPMLMDIIVLKKK